MRSDILNAVLYAFRDKYFLNVMLMNVGACHLIQHSAMRRNMIDSADFLC
jgi:hypothetical protein